MRELTNLEIKRPTIGQPVRVAIVGTFDVSNFGDLLFPLIAEAELRRRLGEVEVERYSYREISSHCWPYAVHCVATLADQLPSFDLLVVGGGHLVRFDKAVAPGYEPSASGLHHPTSYWLTPSLLASATGVPVAWNAIGASPCPRWAAPLLSLALTNADYVAVRDRRSAEILSGVSSSASIKVAPDTAFGVPRLLPKTPSVDFQALQTAIGLTEPYIVVQPSQHLHSHREQILWALQRARGEGITILELPISPTLGDRTGNLGLVSDLTTKLDGWPHPLLIAELIARSSGVIAQSLHLSLVALACGVPVHRYASAKGSKYQIVEHFQGVHLWNESANAEEILLNQLGRRAVGTDVLEQVVQLETHWDAIASLANTKRAPSPTITAQILSACTQAMEQSSDEGALQHKSLNEQLDQLKSQLSAALDNQRQIEGIATLVGSQQTSIEAFKQDLLGTIERQVGKRFRSLNREIKRLNQELANQHDAVLSRLGPRDQAHNGEQPAANDAYQITIKRIGEAARRIIPKGTRTLVVSKGDERLLQQTGRRAWHFPQTFTGDYAGVYPSGTVSAIAQIEAQRLKGAGYLLFPNTAFWWLDHYTGLRDYLERRYRLELQNEFCQIFDLSEARTDLSCGAESIIRQVAEEFSQRHGNPPVILNCASERRLGTMLPELSVFTPPEGGNALPYLDGSIDVVVISEDSPLLDEARRVVAGALIMLPSQTDGSKTNEVASFTWITESEQERTNSISIIVTGRGASAEMDRRVQHLRSTLARAVDVEILIAATCGDVERNNSADNGHAYAGACNAMAAQAKGEVLLFLDSSAAPLEGWIPAVFKTLHDHPDCGALGAKTIAFDGRIDQAGGKVLADGALLRFGEGDYSIEDPLYAFLRPADYAGDLLLATRRELFDRLGGFDTRFNSPAYANADYCFAARSAGCMTYYQPEVNIVHLPPAINAAPRSAADTTTDKATFRSKWKEQLERHPVRRLWYDRDAWHGEAFSMESREVAG